MKYVITAALGGVVVLLSACSSAAAPEETGAGGAPSAATETVPTPAGEQPPAPTAPPDPFTTETGVRLPVQVTFEGGESGVRICEADAMLDVLVDARGSKIVAVKHAPATFRLSAGEAIFFPSGEVYSDSAVTEPVLVGANVYRDTDGRLILGWRRCEDVPEGAPLPSPPFPAPIP